MKILDLFGVKIGLDDSEYQEGIARIRKGQGELVDSTKASADKAEEIDVKASREKGKRDKLHAEHNKKLADSFGVIKREVVAAMAVLVGANSIRDYLQKTTTEYSNLDRAARAAGLSARDLGAFGNMVAVNGGNADSASQSIANLSKVMEDYRTGLKVPGGDVLLGLNRVGAQASDSALDVYQKFADWAEGKDRQLVTQTGSLLGFDEGSIDMAMRGGKAVEEALTKMRAAMPTDGDIAKIRDMRRAFNELASSIKLTASNLLADMSPAITTVLDAAKGALPGPNHVDVPTWSSNGATTAGLGLATRIAQVWQNRGRGNPYQEGSNLPPVSGVSPNQDGRGRGGTRATRNNNPGNIEYGPFARAHGAIGTDGRFAVFPSAQTGFAAMEALLTSKNYRGLSIAGAINRWAPPTENDTVAYRRALAWGGVDMRSSFVNLSPPQRAVVMQSIARHEGWKNLAGNNSRGSSRANAAPVQNVTVQNLNVHTQAKDAPGIGHAVRRSLQTRPIVSDANSGIM